MKSDFCPSYSKDCACARRSKSSLENIRIKDVALLTKALNTLEKESSTYIELLTFIKKIKGDWFINSPKHGFCFWNYMADNRDKKHTLQQCAQLLGVSISAIAVLERKALQKLRNTMTRSDIY